MKRNEISKEQEPESSTGEKIFGAVFAQKKY